MKRFHVHVAVDDLDANIRFYSTLFGAPPSVKQPDYAKWMLDDPRVNFAVSSRGRKPGVDHLGVQVDSADELSALRDHIEQAQLAALDQPDAACCYARSDKYWITDPQGLAWETFHTLDSIPVYGTDMRIAERVSEKAACCAGPQTVTVAPTQSNVCCK